MAIEKRVFLFFSTSWKPIDLGLWVIPAVDVDATKLSATAVWTASATTQDCCRRNIWKLNLFRISKTALSGLDTNSRLRDETVLSRRLGVMNGVGDSRRTCSLDNWGRSRTMTSWRAKGKYLRARRRWYAWTFTLLLFYCPDCQDSRRLSFIQFTPTTRRN